MVEKPPLTLLHDSSFLLSMVKQRRDFERELVDAVPRKIKIRILDLVLYELEHLARKSPSSTRIWAKASLELVAKRGYEVVDHRRGPVDVDASLVSFALSERTPTAIATIDRELRDALRSLGIAIVSPRKAHGLIVEGLS